jgi:hypothetical protein
MLVQFSISVTPPFMLPLAKHNNAFVFLASFFLGDLHY